MPESAHAIDPSRRVLIPTVLPRGLALGGGAAAREVWSFAGETMGTHWRARVAARATDEQDASAGAYSIIHDTLNRVVALMSPWEANSDLSRFAATAGGECVKLAPETAAVLARALEVAELTHGAYDPTLGAVVDLLGFGPSGPQVSHAFDAPEVRAARSAAGYTKLEFDPATRTVRQPGGMRLDLCSIAKGYAVDLASDRLHAAGWANHFIEIGGDARGRGCKPDGQPWWCGIELPSSATPTVAALCELAIASSGNAHHRLTTPAGSVGHIIPGFASDQSPFPAEAATDTVTVLSRLCADADAWATALHALGPDTGLPLAAAHDLAACWSVPATAQSRAREIRTPAFDRLLR